MADEGKPLGQLVADLQREYGPHYYGRRDLHIPEDVKQQAILRARSDGTDRLGRYSVLKKFAYRHVLMLLSRRRCAVTCITQARDR